VRTMSIAQSGGFLATDDTDFTDGESPQKGTKPDEPKNWTSSATSGVARCSLRMLYYLTFLVMFGSVVFFYRAGEIEGTSGFAWAVMSLVISMVILRWLHGGLVGALFGQFALFAGITLYRSRKNRVG
jgi:hypothetical protein